MVEGDGCTRQRSRATVSWNTDRNGDPNRDFFNWVNPIGGNLEIFDGYWKSLPKALHPTRGEGHLVMNPKKTTALLCETPWGHENETNQIVCHTHVLARVHTEEGFVKAFSPDNDPPDVSPEVRIGPEDRVSTNLNLIDRADGRAFYCVDGWAQDKQDQNLYTCATAGYIFGNPP